MGNKKVLVIDDDSEIRASIQDYLEEKGYRVVSADNGKTGYALALKEKPDLVILDVEMPNMNGFDVCRKMREDSDLLHTPILMLTAHNMEWAEVSGFNAGADDYITKPFNPARLLARIESAINRSNQGLDANALTRLPGNKVIMNEIQSHISKQTPFSVLYLDLNNFKAFNDRYGFIRGDQALKATADCLRNAFLEWKKSPSFLGHVGGDDFIGVVETHDVKSLCQKIIADFNTMVPSLYDKKDREAHRILSVNRKGEKVHFPLMGLAIAVVTNHQKAFNHPGEIAVIAGELKEAVKMKPESNFLIDRRT